MIDVITVLKNQERFAADRAREAGKAAPERGGWLASHPSNDQRLQDIRQIAARYPAKPAQGSYADEGTARYRQMLDGMTFGESPEQGVTRGQQFYHPGMGFAMTAPTGWSIQNGAQELTLVNPPGTAGLVVRPVPAELGRSHEQIIRNWVKPTQGQLQGKQINGLTASEFRGQRRNPQGQVQDIRLTLIDGPLNHQYLLMPSARDANVLAQNWSELKAAENSFRALTEADKAAARPWQIRTVPYPRGGFAQLARQSPLMQAPEAQLRLINGFYVAGEPKPGEMVKVIVPR
jgi:predicted Zn-dependent protease